MNNDDDEIIFDRDTSKAKEKLKKRKRRKDKEKSDQNKNDTNINKNMDNSININKIIQTEAKAIKKDENNINTIPNSDQNKSDANINSEKEKKSQNDDMVNFNSQEQNNLSSNLEKDENKQMNIDYNLENDKNNLDNDENNDNMQSLEEVSKNNINMNNRYNDEYNDINQNMNSQSMENDYMNSQNNNTNSNILNSSKNYIYNDDAKIKTEKENLENEYQEALKSGDKDKIIVILQKKVVYYELNINDLNLLIQHLRNDIHKKERIMHLLTDTNNQLKNALNNFSKKLDKKIFEVNNTETNIKAYKNSQSTKKIFDRKYKQLEDDKNINSDYNKLLAKNKLLQKDNDNLKSMIDASNKVEKMKEQENLNKILKEKNSKLEEEISQIKRDIIDHSYCEKKRNALLEKIKYLIEENKEYKKQIKKLTLENQTGQDIPKLNINENTQNGHSNGQNNLNSSRSKHNKMNDTHLPKISKKAKKEENKKDNEIENLTDKDEIYILIKFYQGDDSKFSEFKKKLISYAKCKENIINKYKNDEKMFNKKVYSMQEEIEYLNHKVKESEMRLNIFQQQINDKDFKNKQLKKQLIEEKKEKENLKKKDNK